MFRTSTWDITLESWIFRPRTFSNSRLEHQLLLKYQASSHKEGWYRWIFGFSIFSGFILLTLTGTVFLRGEVGLNLLYVRTRAHSILKLFPCLIQSTKVVDSATWTSWSTTWISSEILECPKFLVILNTCTGWIQRKLPKLETWTSGTINFAELGVRIWMQVTQVRSVLYSTSFIVTLQTHDDFDAGFFFKLVSFVWIRCAYPWDKLSFT